MEFTKFCAGLALGASAIVGSVQGLDGERCDPSSYEGYFLELGLGVGVIGGGVDIGFGGGNPGGLAPSGPPDFKDFSGVVEAGLIT